MKFYHVFLSFKDVLNIYRRLEDENGGLYEQEVYREKLKHLQSGSENARHHQNRYLIHIMSRIIFTVGLIIVFLILVVF